MLGRRVMTIRLGNTEKHACSRGLSTKPVACVHLLHATNVVI